MTVYVKPIVEAMLTKTTQKEISGLSIDDTLIYWGGTNDIHYLLENWHTIIFMGAPHRYDLSESSVINEATRLYSY